MQLHIWIKNVALIILMTYGAYKMRWTMCIFILYFDTLNFASHGLKSLEGVMKRFSVRIPIDYSLIDAR